MYTSYQVPSFDNVFPTDVHSIDSSITQDTANQSMKEQDRFLTYNNNTLGLQIQYPSWLKITDRYNGVEFMFPNKSAGATLATSKIDSTLNDSYAMTHLSYLNRSLDNLHILNASRSDIFGYPTPKILFTYDNGTELYKGLQFWKKKDDSVRLFTYFAPSKEVFDELLPTIDRMLKTVKVS
jgi:hypothetical protein